MSYVENYNIEEWYDEAKTQEHKGPENTFMDWLQMAKAEDFGKVTRLQHQHELISSFIRTEPKIQPVKGALQAIEVDLENSPGKNLETDMIVSETLARVYHEQKKYSLAIQTYQKLRLVNPEKSAYFASLIKKIEKESDNK